MPSVKVSRGLNHSVKNYQPVTEQFIMIYKIQTTKEYSILSYNKKEDGSEDSCKIYFLSLRGNILGCLVLR